MFLLFWGIVFIAAVTLYLHQVYSRFSKMAVKHEKVVPFVGNMSSILLKREHLVDAINRLYYNYPEERFVGHYEFLKSVLVIRDLELIKKIAVKDFEHFLDHRILIDENVDPLFSRNLFSLRGQEWKDMRSTLSPAFTSSKIRLMVPFMVDVGDQMVLNLKKQIKENKSTYLDVEVKDLTTRFANDVIASCAFGLKVDSQTNKENEFYTKGLIASSFKFKQLLVFFLSSAFPWFMKIVKIPLFSKDTMNFFRSLVMDTMQHRKEKNIIRPDVIHLLMEAKKGKLTHDDKTDDDAGFSTVEESSVGKKDVNRVWSDDDLTAQAVLFFVAGFDTVSAAMVFLLYELAVNPKVQEKLYQEIKETDIKSGGKFDYTSVLNMTYMDMVISEALRLWSPGIFLDRLCIKDYNLGRPSDNATEDFIITKGMGLQIPVFAIHRDPNYFPNPERFDPERFSEENKNKINSFAYMPFGLGPRNCIGSRFALCEIKVMAYQLLRYVEVSTGPKTRIPVELDLDSFNLKMKGGHWLRFKARV